MKKEHLTPEDYAKQWAKRISRLSAWEKSKVAETIKTIDKQLEIKRREKMEEDARIRAENTDEEDLEPREEIQAEPLEV
jgi:hypothetical protein